MRTLGWLVRDTFRQSLAQGIFWALVAITLVSILVCLSARISGETPLVKDGERWDFLPRGDAEAPKAASKAAGVVVLSGELTLGFGSVKVPLGRDGRDAVRFLQFLLAGGVADTVGLWLTLLWTAGFLPTFLDERNVSVLLAKPTPRWTLLLGKYLGVLAFVLLQATGFVVGTWAALGLATGIWAPAYLWSIPIILVHFAIFFSFSVLLAVVTRSTVACVFGSIAFWLLCWGMNYARHAVAADVFESEHSSIGPAAVRMVEAGYWLLPKPADVGMLLYDALGAEGFFGQPGVFAIVREHGEFHPALSILFSLFFTAFVLVAAIREFQTTDY